MAMVLALILIRPTTAKAMSDENVRLLDEALWHSEDELHDLRDDPNSVAYQHIKLTRKPTLEQAYVADVSKEKPDEKR